MSGLLYLSICCWWSCGTQAAPICIYGSTNISVAEMYEMFFMKHKEIGSRTSFWVSKSKRLLCQR